MKIFTLFIVFSFFSTTLFAQFRVDGAFRTRLTMDHGYRKPFAKDTDPIFAADQRSRIRLNYKKDRYEIRFTLQDARVWGSEDYYNSTGLQRSTYALGVYEAWLQFNFSDKSNIRIGRQEWKYNYSRLLSHRRWWTTGMAYDAILYRYHNKKSGWFFDLGISYNNETKTASGWYINAYPGRLKTVDFINLKKVVSPKFNATFNFVLSGRQDDNSASTLYMKATEGLILNYNMGKKSTEGFFGTLSAYLQQGTQALTGGGNAKASAFMIDAQLGFRTNNKKFSVGLGVEWLSGHDQLNTDSTYMKEVHTFDLLNGGRHPYYGGEMDYFVVPSESKNGGLIDPYLRLGYKLNNKSTLHMNFFIPMLATNVKTARLDANGDAILYDKTLGYALDMGYSRKISKDVKISVNGAFFHLTDSYREMRGFLTFDANNNITDDNTAIQYMVYTTISITPTFFDTSKKKK